MIFFILTLLIFASLEVVSKPLMPYIDPFALTFWRFSMGFVFFLFYPGMKKRFAEIGKFSKRDWFFLFLLGFLNAFLAMSLLQFAVKESTPATAAAIFCSNPLFVMIISSIAGFEKISARKVIGLLIGVAAIFVIMWEKGFKLNYGAIYAVSAAVIFAGFTVLSKKTVSKIKPFSVNLVSFFFGIVSLSIFMALTGKSFALNPVFFKDYAKLIAFVYLGFIVTGLGYVTFLATIKKYSPVSSSLIFMLKPAVASVFAVIFLGEKLSAYFIAGFIMLLLGTGAIVSEKIWK